MLQAVRALETLKDSVIERDLLDSRIAQRKAALNIQKMELAESTLMSSLQILEPYHASFPVPLACRITRDFYKFKFAEVRGTAQESSRLQMLTNLILGLDLWSDDSKTYKLMDQKQPAFAPLLSMIKMEDEEDTRKVTSTDLFDLIDADAEELEQPKKKLRALKKETSLKAAH